MSLPLPLFFMVCTGDNFTFRNICCTLDGNEKYIHFKWKTLWGEKTSSSQIVVSQATGRSPNNFRNLLLLTPITLISVLERVFFVDVTTCDDTATMSAWPSCYINDTEHWNAITSWSCSQAVSKTVWHMPLLCVRWQTPGDGQRNCPKHVEFYSKNKFEKLVHLIGSIIWIYHDARSLERQIGHTDPYNWRSG